VSLHWDVNRQNFPGQGYSTGNSLRRIRTGFTKTPNRILVTEVTPKTILMHGVESQWQVAKIIGCIG